MRVNFTLEEDAETVTGRTIEGVIENPNGVLIVQVPDYGSSDGQDMILALSYQDGELRLNVWDHDSEEYSHQIVLSKQGSMVEWSHSAPDCDGEKNLCELCVKRAEFKSQGRCYDCEVLNPNEACDECQQAADEEHEAGHCLAVVSRCNGSDTCPCACPGCEGATR